MLHVHVTMLHAVYYMSNTGEYQGPEVYACPLLLSSANKNQFQIPENFTHS